MYNKYEAVFQESVIEKERVIVNYSSYEFILALREWKNTSAIGYSQVSHNCYNNDSFSTAESVASESSVGNHSAAAYEELQPVYPPQFCVL